MDKDLSKISIQYANGIGPRRAGLFSRLGVKSIRDAFYYLPIRYEDRRNLKRIFEVIEGHTETVSGRIVASDLIAIKGRKLKIFEVTVNDGTGILKVKWFNQAFMQKNLTAGQQVIVTGRIVRNKLYKNILEMHSPEYEVVTDEEDSFIHSKRITPIYKLTGGITQKQFRKIMYMIIQNYSEDITDPLPEEIRKRNNLPELGEAIKKLHFPEDVEDIDSLNRWEDIYHKRLSFDELFLFELGIDLLKKNNMHKKGISFLCKGNLINRLLKNLFFKLTDAQKKVISDILDDMKKPFPMNRLIQGDVGCGKTVVALLAMLYAIECGYQTALMAPTEILAEQHFLNIRRMVEPLGITTALFTGSNRDNEGNKNMADANIIIGTHALIQKKTCFRKLGLVIIDEQHKFGVTQRALLREKGVNPDVLVMTATPIPRSLALTLYGDLDLSIIDELPPGRKKIETLIFDHSQKNEIYEVIRKEVNKGNQVYVVYPAIEGSEKIELRSAMAGKAAFEKVFPEFKTGILHGRMPADERERVMLSFKNRELDILVCTTVIEVGIDVSSATVMMIIHAERFGLAQLHQLRGRVGRGSDKSYCILVTYRPYSENAKQRLQAMIETDNGFKIAEKDLSIRGTGQFFGTKQAGMPDLKVADILRDAHLLEIAKREAFKLLEIKSDLNNYPSLRKSIDVFWNGKIEIFRTV